MGTAERRGRSKPTKPNPLQLLLSIFDKTAPATGELVSTRQQPTDSTAKPSVATVTPPTPNLKNNLLGRSEVVTEAVADRSEAYQAPAKNEGEEIPL